MVDLPVRTVWDKKLSICWREMKHSNLHGGLLTWLVLYLLSMLMNGEYWCWDSHKIGEAYFYMSWYRKYEILVGICGRKDYREWADKYQTEDPTS